MSESQKNPSCFSSIFKRLICAANLPTYPDHNQINNTVSSDVLITQKNTQLPLEEQSAEQIKPGIVARLMGLDSMPENNNRTLDESLFFRSKSLNSLHFFPDFTSNRASKSAAFHRRSATVNSSSSFSFKIEEENVGKENRGGVKQSVKKKQGKREKVSEVSFRSKSLNSLHFFPEFNSKKASQSAAFHHRSATVNSSSGFSHLGLGFPSKIEEENVGSSKSQSEENRGGVKQSVKMKKQGRREKVAEVSLKGNERSKSKEKKKKYEEGFATSSTVRKGKKNNGGLIRDGKCAVLMQKQGRLGGGLRVNDVGLNASTNKRVHHNHDNNDVDHEVLSDSLSRSPVLSDALSRSPVSVLDHHLLHLHHDYSPSKGLFSAEDERRTITNVRNKPTKTKPKIHKETPQQNITLEAPQKKDCDDEVSSRIQRPKFDNNLKSKNATDDQEAEVEEYFVGLLGQICRLAEEEVKDPNWVAKSQGFRVHFVEELSLDFGGQILDLLLDQLLDELVYL